MAFYGVRFFIGLSTGTLNIFPDAVMLMIILNLVKEEKKAQHIFLSASLPIELKQSLLDLFKELTDVFAWMCAEMPRLDLYLITY